ncbi:hypothetical protein BKA70DRAFT_1313363 [Coprinopsis sp. MPI-PUGE-AT-0042]|nr:hypothetical protein BKA70DRAFT_1313363 [Coprinopsis sp. MPI-PUGE-AT-0042]
MGLQNLPADIQVVILRILDAIGIVSMRQTCKALYSVEKTFYATIWKACAESLCLEASLFPPTLNWRLPSPKYYEVMARRASGFRSMLSAASRDNASTEPLPKSEFDLPDLPFLAPNIAIDKIILLPGGRFLIILAQSQPIQVYDLALYYTNGDPPVLIASFPLSHQFSGLNAVASTLAGPGVSCVRLLLQEYAYGPNAVAGGRTYNNLAYNECVLRLVLYELRFGEDTLSLASIGNLPMLSSGAPRGPPIGPFHIFSTCGQRFAFVGTSAIVVWDFISKTYAIWFPQLNPSLNITEVRLSGDYFFMFASHSGDETDKVFCYNFSLSPIPLGQALRLRSAPFASRDAQVDLKQRGLLRPGKYALNAWGLGLHQSFFPLWSLPREATGIDTRWMSGDPGIGSQSLLTKHRGAELRYALHDYVGFRKSLANDVVFIGKITHPMQREISLLASISADPAKSSCGPVQDVPLIPLLQYPSNVEPTLLDFCPLAGILVSRKTTYEREGPAHTITIHDFLRSQ